MREDDNSKGLKLIRLRRQQAELERMNNVPAWKYYLVGMVLFLVLVGGLNVLVMVKSSEGPVSTGWILRSLGWFALSGLFATWIARIVTRWQLRRTKLKIAEMEATNT